MRAKPISRCALAVVATALLIGGVGCGGAASEADPDAQRPVIEGPSGKARGERTSSKDARAEETVRPSQCPAGLPSCRSAKGRIVYVERVDPDGDGDAHFVIRDPRGITLPGLTAIDVRAGLRPHPLPGPGDLISAAGPVQTGSYGQSQIHALELRVGTARRLHSRSE